ncbi:alpha/beta hydrolase [Lysinibacter sp. HNR]|uniref:alpha/beta fold hydrolase n=1 Tax=Lysinibacter sp. HNR TaxID=3031408 RepID=UPI0024357FB5|nr:alpha/beta hydrolase [Lysinibacter sp. HNR]WGD36205.1 alpha/beta hydrolase [Lysinibacter sp. HNR]
MTSHNTPAEGLAVSHNLAPDDTLRKLIGTQRTIEIRNARGMPIHHTSYWEYPPATPTKNGSSVATIVLIHGFRGDHHGLLLIAARLPQYRLIVPDLPGFGTSPAFLRGQHNIEAYAEWLKAFVGAVSEADHALYLLGHSFGSIICSAAVAAGLRPDKLFLVNPIGAPALSGPRGVLTRLAVFYYWLGAKLPQRLGYAFLTNRLITRLSSVAMVKTRDKQLRRWIHHQHDLYFSAFASREVVLESFRASVSHDVSEFAQDIPVSTVLIAADRDDITAISAQKKVARRFVRGKLEIIEGVGHLVHYEKPAVAAQIIRDFIEAP